MILGELQPVGGAGPKLVGKIMVAGGERDDRAPLGNADDRGRDRFGAEAVILAGFEAEGRRREDGRPRSGGDRRSRA